MRKYLFILLTTLFSMVGAQEYNDPCVACAESQGYYCGDDESNWTQYSPEGCVQNSWINDGWEDCINGSDENGAVPTPMSACVIDAVECDTVYVDVPVIEYVEVIEYDTIYTEVIEYDTMFVDVIEEVEVFVYDTIVEVEYMEIIIAEYIDCTTGLPCTSGMAEILKESLDSNLLYNLEGKVIRKPKGIYIQNGKVKWQK